MCLENRRAPKMMTLYAGFAVALLTLDVLLTFVLWPHDRIFDSVPMGRLGFAIVSLPWPILAGILMNLRRAKRACGFSLFA